MCNEETLKKVKEEIEQLKSDFHALRESLPKSGVKCEFDKMWSQIDNQMEIINGLVNQRNMDFTNLERFREILEDVDKLEDNFTTLKNEFKNVKSDLSIISSQQREIVKHQQDWSKLHVNVDLAIKSLKKSIESIENAREKREKERKLEKKERKKENRDTIK